MQKLLLSAWKLLQAAGSGMCIVRPISGFVLQLLVQDISRSQMVLSTLPALAVLDLYLKNSDICQVYLSIVC